MNAAPKYDVTIDGLTRAEYLRVEDAILRGGTIRDGINLYVNITAPEPKAEPDMTHGGVLPCSDGSIIASSINADDLAAGGTITRSDVERIFRSGPAVPPEQESYALPELTPPPGRGLGYLASLVVDLPGNSTAVVMGDTRGQALDTYREIAQRIEAHHRDEIAKAVAVNGGEHTVLRNGTVLRPQLPAGAGRNEHVADLVILASNEGQYTNALHERAARAAAHKAGRIVLAFESSAS